MYDTIKVDNGVVNIKSRPLYSRHSDENIYHGLNNLVCIGYILLLYKIHARSEMGLSKIYRRNWDFILHEACLHFIIILLTLYISYWIDYVSFLGLIPEKTPNRHTSESNSVYINFV